MDMVLSLSEEYLGPDRQDAVFHLFTANVDGQHRSIAAFSAMMGIPVGDVLKRPFDLSKPHLRKEMECYYGDVVVELFGDVYLHSFNEVVQRVVFSGHMSCIISNII